MALITIIISLLFEKYYRELSHWRNFTWFHAYLRWIWRWLQQRPQLQGPLAVLVTLAPPLLAIGLGLLLLYRIHPLLGFTAGIVVCVFSLGPQNLHELTQDFIRARQQQHDAESERLLHAILGDLTPGRSEEVHAAIVARIFIATNERLLAVLFWLLLLGPLGAALLRLACVTREVSGSTQAPEFLTVPATRAAFERLPYLLLWLPARLTALGFAITGSFVHTFELWRRHRDWSPYWPDANDSLLVACGFGALQSTPALGRAPGSELSLDHTQEALHLTLRSVLLWLVVYSILILAGWTGYA